MSEKTRMQSIVEEATSATGIVPRPIKLSFVEIMNIRSESKKSNMYSDVRSDDD